MKKRTQFIVICLMLCQWTYGQYDLTNFDVNETESTRIENNGGDLFYSSNFVSKSNDNLQVAGLSNAAGPDTAFFPVTVAGEITPSSGVNTSHDTLTIEVAVGYWGNKNSSIRTLEADYTIKNRYASYAYTNQSRNTAGASELYDEFKFVEGETDTVMLIVTAGRLALDRIYVRASNATVISDASDDLFGKNGATVSNPVTDGDLSILLPSDISSTNIALLSMEGRIIETKEITATNNSFDVSRLKGMYFLKDLSTASFKKVIIK